jgi:hypothetical protein
VNDLERDLEQLNKLSEAKWLSYLEFDGHGKLHLGERFIQFKMEVTSLRETLERHFNKTMKSIQQGIPEVKDDGKADKSDYNF